MSRLDDEHRLGFRQHIPIRPSRRRRGDSAIPRPCRSEMERFVAAKTKRDLYLRAIDRGILLAPCNTVQDIAESEQLAARDFWIDLEHPTKDDRKLTHLGPFIKLSESPINIRRPAPKVGEQNREILSRPPQNAKQETTPPNSYLLTPNSYPFTGIKILDFSWVGVGPITTKHLADFGADVIRIESVSRPDTLRNGAPFKDGVPGINRSQFSANYNSSKRGLGLNLATERGRELVKELIREVAAGRHSRELHPARDARMGLGIRRRSQARSRRHLLQHLPAGADRPALRLRGLRDARRRARGLLPHHRLGRPRTGGTIRRLLRLREPAERSRRNRRRPRIPAANWQGTAPRPVAVRVRHALPSARHHGLHGERADSEPPRQRRRCRCAAQRLSLRRPPPRLHRRRRAVDSHMPYPPTPSGARCAPRWNAPI